MGVGSTGWNILGTLFRCREAPPEVGEKLSFLLSGFAESGPPIQRIVDFAILRRNGTTEMVLSRGTGTSLAPIPLRAPFAGWAEYHLVCGALALARDHWALHAAAVVAPGGTCVILGRKDAGKTTLALSLWAQGMAVLADDVLPMPYASRSPDRFPRAFHTDPELLARLRHKIPPRPAAYPERCYPFPGTASLEVPPVTSLLVLMRGGRAQGEVRPIEQSEAVHRVVRGSIRTEGFDFSRVLESALALSRDCSAYSIHASTPEGAAERALEVLTASQRPLRVDLTQHSTALAGAPGRPENR